MTSRTIVILRSYDQPWICVTVNAYVGEPGGVLPYSGRLNGPRFLDWERKSPASSPEPGRVIQGYTIYLAAGESIMGDHPRLEEVLDSSREWKDGFCGGLGRTDFTTILTVD